MNYAKKLIVCKRYIKNKKKIDDTYQQSEDLSNVIKEKRTHLNEYIYEMKTLQCTISKLKQDNF